MKNRKGFTLIELLAVIVILAVIALIATPIMLNMIEKSRKSSAKDSAYGYIEALENKIAQQALLGITYEDKDDYAYEDIKVDMKGTKPTYVKFSLEKGIIKTGVFCINNYTVDYKNNKVTVGEICNEEELKYPGNIELSETKGVYKYPNPGTFTVKHHGGILTCGTSNEKVATCFVEENKVTVIPGKEKGSATITVVSESTSKYKRAQAAYIATTEEGTLNSYTVIGYKGIYDEEAHGITVTSSGSTIKYGEEEGIYDLDESPTYSDVGIYTVYYQIETEGYETVKGSETVEITKAEGKIKLEEESGKVEYNKIKEIKITENKSNGKIEIKTENEEIAEVKEEDGILKIKGKKSGKTTIIVKSEKTHNYKEAETKYEIEVERTNNTLTLSATTGNYTYPTSGTFEVTENKSGGTLTCGTSNSSIATCEINGNIVTVVPGKIEGSATITIESAETTNYNKTQVAHEAITAKGTIPSVTANGYEGTYDGASHGITVTTTLSGATIKYGTNNGTYDKTESPTYINAGTYTVYYQISKEGYTTIEDSVSVKIAKKADGITITPQTYTYNGSGRSTSVKTTSGLIPTVTYYSDESCATKTTTSNATSAGGTPKNAGTYYVTATTAGNTNYNTASKGCTKAVVINKAENTLTLSSGSATYTYPTSGTFTITKNTSGGALSCSTANSSIATCSISGTTVKVTPGIIAASTTITITSEETTNYNKGQTTHKVTTAKGTIPSVTATGYSAEYDGAAHGITVTTTLSGATIKYGTTSGTYDRTSSPTYTNVGTYTVYYQVSKSGYTTVTGNRQVVIKDTTAPSATISGVSTSWATSDAVTIALSDAGRGLAGYAVTTSTSTPSSWTSVTGKSASKTYSATANGTYYVHVKDAGGLTSYKSFKISYVDRIAPSVPALKNSSGEAWTKSDVTVEVSSTDTLSGVKTIEYGYDGTTWRSDDWIEDVAITNGKKMIGKWTKERGDLTYFRACDNAGNCSTSSTYIKIDKTAPSVPTLKNSSGGSWTKGPVTVEVSSTDTLSGVKVLEYSYDGTTWVYNDWYEDYTKITNGIKTKGVWTVQRDNTVYFRACDNAGNCSANSTTKIRIDHSLSN